MARVRTSDPAPVRNLAAEGLRTRYFVVRQEDVWFIKFDGEEYGPYQTEREAMLFAIDAANKLGEQGEDTQVLPWTRTAMCSRSGPTGPTRIRRGL